MFSLFIMFVDPLYYQWLQAVTTLETKQKNGRFMGFILEGKRDMSYLVALLSNQENESRRECR